jgi:glutathione peroxidase
MRKLKMKLLASGAMALMTGCFFGKSKTVDAQTAKESNPNESIYTIKIMQLDEKTALDLSQYKGKKILFVNTASECGFTPQYEDLQKLQDKYPEKLVVIGSPCNQFGGQEPGNSDQIATFCKKNFGVTFMLTQKLDVKGTNQHPLFQWLTSKSKNGVLDSEVKWNFNKFLVDENGKLVAYFASTTGPMSSDITKLIDK